MKTFEERYTAWIDGKLSAAELADFERELETRPEAAADKKDVERLGHLLRRHADVPSLTNADFFSHQMMARIAADSSETRAVRRHRWWTWSLPQLAMAGAACLLVAGGLFKMMIPVGAVDAGKPYFAEIVDARTDDPHVSATPVYNAKDNVTVLWLDGLDYLPASYKLD
jgi:anti-sigma factor RsiW